MFTKADIKCPFFTAETEKALKCEGVVDRTRNSIRFESESDKQEYLGKHCVFFPNACPIAIAAEKKYE